MDLPRKRAFSRYGIALGSTGFMAGAAIIIAGSPRTGQIIMIVGGVLLFVAASVLANTPTGDQDAG